MGLVFPLSGTLGILAGFAPGGIGVREGLMVSCLVLAGFEITEAATISIASRLWFLIGESFIFAIGLIADRLLRK